MPTRLSVERTPDRLSVGFDTESPRIVKLTVGRNMTPGVKYEMRVFARGGARPVDPGAVGYAGIREPVGPSDLSFLSGRAFLNSTQGGIPAAGKRYIIEVDVSIFETNVPAQHFWSPVSRRYRVLWAETLETVK
jgi:hypothetical protein